MSNVRNATGDYWDLNLSRGFMSRQDLRLRWNCPVLNLVYNQQNTEPLIQHTLKRPNI